MLSQYTTTDLQPDQRRRGSWQRSDPNGSQRVQPARSCCDRVSRRNHRILQTHGCNSCGQPQKRPRRASQSPRIGRANQVGPTAVSSPLAFLTDLLRQSDTSTSSDQQNNTSQQSARSAHPLAKSARSCRPTFASTGQSSCPNHWLSPGIGLVLLDTTTPISRVIGP